jgi:hypothetical protein
MLHAVRLVSSARIMSMPTAKRFGRMRSSAAPSAPSIGLRIGACSRAAAVGLHGPERVRAAAEPMASPA